MTIETSLLINIGTIVFAAGVLYSKVSTLEKKVERMEDHGEKIAAMDAHLKAIQKIVYEK